jgi:hypothetical protein
MHCLIENFNNDSYSFISNPRHIKDYRDFPLQEGLQRMREGESLHLSFADQLAINNPMVDADINRLFADHPRAGGLIDYTLVKQSFISCGTEFSCESARGTNIRLVTSNCGVETLAVCAAAARAVHAAARC